MDVVMGGLSILKNFSYKEKEFCLSGVFFRQILSACKGRKEGLLCQLHPGHPYWNSKDNNGNACKPTEKIIIQNLNSGYPNSFLAKRKSILLLAVFYGYSAKWDFYRYLHVVSMIVRVYIFIVI